MNSLTIAPSAVSVEPAPAPSVNAGGSIYCPALRRDVGGATQRSDGHGVFRDETEMNPSSKYLHSESVKECRQQISTNLPRTVVDGGLSTVSVMRSFERYLSSYDDVQSAPKWSTLPPSELPVTLPPLERAYFAERCWRLGLQPEGREVTLAQVDECYCLASNPIEYAGFRERCCLMGLSLSGQLVTADQVMNDYRAAGAPPEVLEHFRTECYQRGLLPQSFQAGSGSGCSGLVPTTAN